MTIRAGAILAMAVLLPVAPAAASAFIVTLSGTVLFVPPSSPNPIENLGFGTGDSFSGRWRIDLGAGTPFDVPLAGLVGPQRVYAFSVTQGAINIASAGGTTRFSQAATSRGAILVLDNYAFSAPLRQDQVSILDGVRFDGGLVETYDIDGPVPSGTFLRGISFGKLFVGPVASPPTLVTSLDRPDFAAILASGAPTVAFFNLSRGTPASNADLAALPTSNFNVVGPVFTITAVPEPGSWAMLIAGFGLVGAAMRRRPATSAVAAAQV